jgi:pimeloyl-ACP methyl ester carboxylesterase
MAKQILGKILIVGLALAALYAIWHSPKPARAALGAQSFVVRPDGAKIAWYAQGQGPRVVLLASLGRSVSDFNELSQELVTAGYRTVAVEVRGIGASTIGTPKKRPDLFNLADDVAAAVIADGATDGDRVFVIGHAFGNRLARALATRYADQVGGVVLIAAGGTQKLEPDQRITQALRNCFDWHRNPIQHKREVRYAFFADENPVPGYWLRGWYEKGATLEVIAVQKTPNSEWQAAGGSAPMLVIQAAQDRVAPAATTSAILKQSFPERVQLVTLNSAGHAILPEQPKMVAATIVSFLDAQTR